MDRPSSSRYRYCVVCSSNQNRSMEAHCLFVKNGLVETRSFGTGTQVKLPGKSAREPNVYSFGTKYQKMYEDLESQDRIFYTNNGLLRMLDRNRNCKEAPERFQDSPAVFDVCLTCEERVYDQTIEELYARESLTYKPLHVINLDIKDSHAEAATGSLVLWELVELLEKCNDLEDGIDGVIGEFERAHPERPLLHSTHFY